jgi:hypothetical protein
MRYYVVPCSKRSTAVAMAGVQQFNLGITTIPAIALALQILMIVAN